MHSLTWSRIALLALMAVSSLASCRLFVEGAACDPNDPRTCPEGAACNLDGVCVVTVAEGEGEGDEGEGEGDEGEGDEGEGEGEGDEGEGEGDEGEGEGEGEGDVCGDAVVGDGEQCDGGLNCRGPGDINGECTLQICGDNIVDNGEACDGAPDCNADCTRSECGDLIVNLAEECDGGFNCRAPGDPLECTVRICGDGIVDPTCTPSVCGDGFVDLGELCLAQGTTVPTAVLPADIEAGDVDDDGTIDLVVAHPGATDAFELIKGNGDGTFGLGALSTGSVAGANVVSIGDLNNDGELDAVGTGPSNQIGVVITSGGVLGAGLDPPVGSGLNDTRDIAVAFVDDDAFLDVAVIALQSNALLIHFGNGDGTLRDPPVLFGTTYDPNFFAATLATADFDNDGAADFVAGCSQGQGTLLFMNTGSGNGDGEPTTLIASGVGGVGDVATGDLDGDGNDDFVTGNIDDNSLGLHFGNGDGTFDAAQNLPLGVGPGPIVLSDLNDDGRDDIIVVTPDQKLRIERPSAGRALQPVTFFDLLAPGTPTVGDFNGDGRGDIAVVEFNGTNQIEVFVSSSL